MSTPRFIGRRRTGGRGLHPPSDRAGGVAPCAALRPRGGDREALVLIVDDDESSRLVLQRGLSLAGWTALPVDDGREVWPILEREEVAVLILDLRMEGMDGFEVIRRLRAEERTGSRRPTGILVVSGMSEFGVTDRVLAAGADAFHAKPIDLFAVLRAVRRLHRIVRWKAADG